MKSELPPLWITVPQLQHGFAPSQPISLILQLYTAPAWLNSICASPPPPHSSLLCLINGHRSPFTHCRLKGLTFWRTLSSEKERERETKHSKYHSLLSMETHRLHERIAVIQCPVVDAPSTIRSGCICWLSLASKPSVCPGSVPETDLYIRQSALLPRSERAVSLCFCFWKRQFAEGTASLARFLT